MDKRRRTYVVAETVDRMEMGRKGKAHFTYREIDPDELVLGELLGEGAYGKVGVLLLVVTFFEFFFILASNESSRLNFLLTGLQRNIQGCHCW